MGPVGEFVECVDCEFVLLSEGTDEPKPKRTDSCPDCGGTEFAFVEN